jgi:isocitrate dehydrogenase
MGAVMMLVHIGQAEVAERVHNAWLRTMEDGIHTYDVYAEGVSKQKVGTREFADAVAARMGQKPEKLKVVSYSSAPSQMVQEVGPSRPRQKKDMVGVDVFLEWTAGTADELGAALSKLTGADLDLIMLSNRGTKVWPGGFPDTLTCDTWRCRFMSKQGPNANVSHEQILQLLTRLRSSGYDFVKMESLCNFDGQPGYSLGQGQ